MISLVHLLPTQVILRLGLSGFCLLAAAGVMARRQRRLSLLLGVGAVGIFVFGYGAFAPHSQLFGAVSWKIEVPDKVALTFDDGPGPRFTPAILDQLKQAHAKATFFVLGKQVERYPALARRIVAGGHALGSHGYSHRPFTFMSRAEIRDELERTDRAIDQATGQRPKLFRPPYGFRSPWLSAETRRLGYRTVGWSLSVRDSQPATAAEISRRAENGLHSGQIALIHDGRGDRRQSVAALGEILRFATSQGWQPVTVPELLANKCRPTQLLAQRIALPR